MLFMPFYYCLTCGPLQISHLLLCIDGKHRLNEDNICKGRSLQKKHGSFHLTCIPFLSAPGLIYLLPIYLLSVHHLSTFPSLCLAIRHLSSSWALKFISSYLLAFCTWLINKHLNFECSHSLNCFFPTGAIWVIQNWAIIFYFLPLLPPTLKHQLVLNSTSLIQICISSKSPLTVT